MRNVNTIHINGLKLVITTNNNSNDYEVLLKRNSEILLYYNTKLIDRSTLISIFNGIDSNINYIKGAGFSVSRELDIEKYTELIGSIANDIIELINLTDDSDELF